MRNEERSSGRKNLSSNFPAKDVLRIGKDALFFRVAEEGRVQDGIRDRLHLREGGHEGRDVWVVGSEDELARRDAVGEEAADLVVEDGAGAVVPESVGEGELVGGCLMDLVRGKEWFAIFGRELGG